MILNDSELNNRIDSPLNLLNRLNKLTTVKNDSMSIFRGNAEITARTNLSDSIKIDERTNPAVIADDQFLGSNVVDELIDDLDKKINLGLIKTKAADVLNQSLDALKLRLPEIQRVKDLSTIAKEMNSIIVSEDAKKNNIGQQVIVYRPVMNELNKYETVISHE